MANIDTSSIDGFESMEPADQVKALLGLEIPESVDMSKFISKESFDKKASELAAANKKIKEQESALKNKSAEQMTETEKLQEQIREMQEANKETIETLKAENAEMKRKDTLRDYQTNLTLLGFEEKLATDTATALVDSEITKVFANWKKFLDAHDRAFEAELMSRTPRPDGYGSGDKEKENPALAYVKKRAAQRSEVTRQAEEARNKFFS